MNKFNYKRFVSFYATLFLGASLTISCAHNKDNVATDGSDGTVAEAQAGDVASNPIQADNEVAAATAATQASDAEQVVLMDESGVPITNSDAETPLYVASATDSAVPDTVTTGNAPAVLDERAPSADDKQLNSATENSNVTPTTEEAKPTPEKSEATPEKIKSEAAATPQHKRHWHKSPVAAARVAEPVAAAPQEAKPVLVAQAPMPFAAAQAQAQAQAPAKMDAPAVAVMPDRVINAMRKDIPDVDPFNPANAPVKNQAKAKLASPDLSQLLLQNLFLVSIGFLATGFIIFLALRRGKDSTSHDRFEL